MSTATGFFWQNAVGQPGGLGNVDGRGQSARFCQPWGLAVDASGTVYVADYYNYAIRKVAPDGTVTTLAGCVGECGGNDGVGNGARFDRPMDVAVDVAGNLYVADSGNHVIRKVTVDGVVTTLAGRAGEQGSADGAARDARFRSPSGVAVDSAGNVFVADTANHTIRKVSPAGSVTTVAGKAELKSGQPLGGYADGTGSVARFRAPRDVAVDAAGTLFVADTDNSVLRKITAAGLVTTLAGAAGSPGNVSGTGAVARLSSPQSVALDASGNLYVADAGNLVVRKVTAAGAVSTVTNGLARFSSPRGLAVDPAGNLLVSDNDLQTISRIMPKGGVSVVAGCASHHGYADGSGDSVRFNRPTGIDVDPQGNLWVADNFTHVLRKIRPDGSVTTVAGRAGSSGTADGTNGAARFNWPCGVAGDQAGNAYVADSGSHTVRKVTPDGTVSTLAGTPGTSGSSNGVGNRAQFAWPSDVAVDGAGNVFVADRGNHVIRKVTALGVVTTLAGSAGRPGRADGAGVGARFNAPAGVAVDHVGNIYVADTGNHTVRRVTPGGEVSTLAGSAGMKGSVDGTGPLARFNGPSDVVADGAGRVIVTDRDNHMIRLVTAEGVVTTLGGMPNLMSAAEGFGAAARFAQPSGVAVDRSGILYVADACNHRIVAGIPSDGTRTFAAWPAPAFKAPPLGDVSAARDVPYSWEVFVGQPNASGAVDGTRSEARLTRPQGVAFDERGALFVVDGGNALRRVSPKGEVTTLSGTRDRMKAPIGVAVGVDGACYVTDGAHVLWRVSVSGEVSAFAGSMNKQGDANGTGGAARFNFIPGVAVDAAGNVYVADHNNFTVRKVTPDGRVTTFAGLAGSRGCFDGVGSAARFSLPTALATDRSGNVYVADDNRIRMITPQGAVQTVSPSVAPLGRLDGIAVDQGGTVYVADRDHHVIWRVAPRGAVSKLAGSGLVMGGEGWVVTGLAVDRLGNVYVSDAARNCIVKGVKHE